LFGWDQNILAQGLVLQSFLLDYPASITQHLFLAVFAVVLQHKKD